MTLLPSWLTILFLFVLLLLLVIIALSFYHKAFKHIKIKEGPFRSFRFAYKFHEGDYQQNMLIMEQVLKNLQNKNVPIANPATIYYDNPKKTKRTKLRSEIGFIVPDSVKQSQVGTISLKTIKHNTYIYTTFPYISQFSIMLGAMRVYPALKKYLKKYKAEEKEIIEIYEMQNKNIIYLMPFEK